MNRFSAKKKQADNCNDCNTCPYRQKVVGSAHSSCHYPFPDQTRFTMIAGVIEGKQPYLHIGSKTFLEINDYGFEQGWALYPFNFDPTWIRCKLPILHERTENV